MKVRFLLSLSPERSRKETQFFMVFCIDYIRNVKNHAHKKFPSNLSNRAKEEEKNASESSVRVISAFDQRWPWRKNALGWKTERQRRRETKNTSVVEYRHRNAVPNIVYVAVQRVQQQHIIHFKYRSVSRTKRARAFARERAGFDEFPRFILLQNCANFFRRLEVFACKMVLFAPKTCAFNVRALGLAHERKKERLGEIKKCWRNLPRCGSFENSREEKMSTKQVTRQSNSILCCRCENGSWRASEKESVAEPMASAYGKRAHINQKNQGIRQS